MCSDQSSMLWRIKEVVFFILIWRDREYIYVADFSFIHTFAKENLLDSCFIWNNIDIASRRSNNIFNVQNSNTNLGIIYIWHKTKNDRAKLLKIANLIIWDEAPTTHKYFFETLDKTLKDIMLGSKSSNKIFGGKVVVFDGDFRKIIPVIPRGSRSDIIHAALNSSYIWDHCKVLRLTKNMRLQQSNMKSSDYELEQFSHWIFKVGDGKLVETNDGYVDISITI